MEIFAGSISPGEVLRNWELSNCTFGSRRRIEVISPFPLGFDSNKVREIVPALDEYVEVESLCL